MNLEPCIATVNQYLSNRISGLQRLKEMLPVLFQFHKVYVTDRQRAILLACNLDPTVEQGVGVTFNLPLEILKMSASMQPLDSTQPRHLRLDEERRVSLKLARLNKPTPNNNRPQR
jgi:hypothetical protein